MAILGGLAKAAAAGANSTNFDYDVYIKVDGTWELLQNYPNANATFTTVSNTGQFDLVMDEAPTYENTGGVDVVVTEMCVGGVQSSGDLTASLNSDQTSATVNNSLVFKIGTVAGSPRTVVPSEIIQITQIQQTIES